MNEVRRAICQRRGGLIRVMWARGIQLVALSVTLTLGGGVGSARGVEDTALGGRLEDVGALDDIPTASKLQLGVRVFAVEDDQHAAASREWFQARIRHANRLFGVIGVEFRVVSWERVHAASAAVGTRAERDALGAERAHQGQVDVYLVRRLTDVDAPPNEIRGVHWRLRRNTSARWIIMSEISGSMVLAHELGHFFSLPHGAEVTSIMNKRPRERPRWENRVFTSGEQVVMRAALEKMLVSGRLVPLSSASVQVGAVGPSRSGNMTR